MLKKNLIDAVASDTGISKKDTRRVMDSIVAITRKHLVAGGDVMLFGLGKLHVVKRGPKVARNIHTGEKVIVPPRLAVVMAPNDAIVKEVNAASQG